MECGVGSGPRSSDPAVLLPQCCATYSFAVREPVSATHGEYLHGSAGRAAAGLTNCTPMATLP